MRSGIFRSKHTPTPIEKFPELEKILKLIRKLSKKEQELKSSAETNGPHSLDQQKLDIVSPLLDQMNQAINQFNEKKIENPQKELAALAGTVHKLFLLVSNTYRLDDNILMLPRNKRREIASQVVYSGTFIATATTSTVLFPTPLGAVASLAYVAPMTTQKVGEISGLNDTTPESMRIVNQLYKHLSELDQHLKRKYYNQKFQNDDDEKIRKYTCPITLCIMNDPVACRLDGFSYERVAIEQWLREKRNSPINRSRIPAGQTIQDVLTTNRNLKTAINDFLSENPAIIDDEIETKPKLVILKT